MGEGRIPNHSGNTIATLPYSLAAIEKGTMLVMAVLR